MHKHWTVVPDDRHEFYISMGDDGRLRKKDMAGRWRIVDESGTGIRVRSKRPPNIPGDAYCVLTRTEREHDAAPLQHKEGPNARSRGRTQPVKGITRVGCDIGGVITRRAPSRRGAVRQQRWYDDVKSATPGCVDAVRAMVKMVGPENFYFASKAKPPMQAKIRKWLGLAISFWKPSGALEKNLVFRPEPTGPEAKGPIVRRLGLTHFTDDRTDILDEILETAVQGWKDWRSGTSKVAPSIHHFYQHTDSPTPKNLSNADRFDAVGNWKDIVGNITLSSFHFDSAPAADSIKEPTARRAAPVRRIGDH